MVKLNAAIYELVLDQHPAKVKSLCSQLKSTTVDNSFSLSGFFTTDTANGLLDEVLKEWKRVGCSSDEIAGLIAGISFGYLEEKRRENIELVWTGPDLNQFPVRRSEQVLLDVINSSIDSLFIVSFVLVSIPDIEEAIKQAVERGVDVRMLIESEDKEHSGIFLESVKRLYENIAGISLYVWPRDKREIVDGGFARVHAKCAVADKRVAFVTSANLTSAALDKNIEMGVHITGGNIPLGIHRQFISMINSKEIILYGEKQQPVETIIEYPNTCNANAIFKFCSEVVGYGGIDYLIIDFSQMRRIEPFTMVYVAKIIREFNKDNPNTVVRCIGYKDKGYAANMGFFRAFGLKHGRDPNCTDGNDKFIPFTILRVQTIVDEANEEWEVEQDTIERRSEQLAQILTQQETSDLIDAVTFSVREIMRNVFEHSNSKSIEYCAQYWPSYEKVEIAISDSGIGLRESLTKNPFVHIENDSDAIQQALMPAISSKNYKGAKVDSKNPWHNSGFGLYMINRLCRLGGSFLICSGDHGIKLDENGKEHINLGHYCKGTVVRLVLNTSRLEALDKMLSVFRDEGYVIAQEIKGVGMYKASAASQMLSRDFKKVT